MLAMLPPAMMIIDADGCYADVCLFLSAATLHISAFRLFSSPPLHHPPPTPGSRQWEAVEAGETPI